MQVTLDNDEGDDYATLVLSPEKDDDFSVSHYLGSVQIRIPLFAYQARELIEVMTPLAERKELE